MENLPRSPLPFFHITFHTMLPFLIASIYRISFMICTNFKRWNSTPQRNFYLCRKTEPYSVHSVINIGHITINRAQFHTFKKDVGFFWEDEDFLDWYLGFLFNKYYCNMLYHNLNFVNDLLRHPVYSYALKICYETNIISYP